MRPGWLERGLLLLERGLLLLERGLLRLERGLLLLALLLLGLELLCSDLSWFSWATTAGSAFAAGTSWTAMSSGPL